MTALLNRFAPIQQAIEAENKFYGMLLNRLSVAEIDDMLHIHFDASPFDEYFDDLITLLCAPDIAPRLNRLIFASHDTGANGTRHWDFGHILKTDATFPNLIELSVELYNPLEHHNHPIICGWRGGIAAYEEMGILAKWLDKAPNLRWLTAPSAPNSDFFKRDPTLLEKLHIQAGFDTQGFIANFSQATCFPKLWQFEYQDFHDTRDRDYTQKYTPLADFRALFQSPAFDSIRSFVWYNPIFSDTELRHLKALRPKLGFEVVKTHTEWLK